MTTAAGLRAVETGGWITAMAAWADYDGDGDLDLYLANGSDEQTQPDALYANNGDGTFRHALAEARLPSTALPHMAVGWGDFDDNGAPDLYVTDGWGYGNRLFQNTTSPERFIRVRVQGRASAIGARVRLMDANTGELRAYQQVLSGTGELIFGAPDGPYDVQVLFPGNDTPAIVEDVRGGGEPVFVVEP